MMIEKEILDYLQFGKMVTAIEAEFSHITIGDAHAAIQLLEQFTFGEIREENYNNYVQMRFVNFME